MWLFDSQSRSQGAMLPDSPGQPNLRHYNNVLPDMEITYHLWTANNSQYIFCLPECIDTTSDVFCLLLQMQTTQDLRNDGRGQPTGLACSPHGDFRHMMQKAYRDLTRCKSLETTDKLMDLPP